MGAGIAGSSVNSLDLEKPSERESADAPAGKREAAEFSFPLNTAELENMAELVNWLDFANADDLEKDGFFENWLVGENTNDFENSPK